MSADHQEPLEPLTPHGGPRCQGRAKSTGRQCAKPATPGATVCVKHGSGAPQVRAAAARRVEQAKAARQLQALGQPVEVDPASALLGLVHAKAGEVAWLREKVREVARDSGDEGGKHLVVQGIFGESQTVWWTLLRSAEDQLEKFCSAALKAGIEERRVRLAEEQGLLVAGVVRRILDRLGLTAEQWALVATVAPEELRALEGAS